jgi:hypothetical protein
MAELNVVKTPGPLDDDYVPQPSFLNRDPEWEQAVADRRQQIRLVAKEETKQP